MAILTKIRKLPIVLIILVIGLPLLTFVIDPSSIKSFFNSSKYNSVGEVAGQEISRKDFAEKLENYKRQTNGRVSDIQATKSVWNSISREKVYQEQLKKSGLTIGEHDIFNQICEASFVKNDTNFKTNGVFDKLKLKKHLANIKQNQPKQWQAWKNYMLEIKSSLETNTYNDLIKAGLNASLKEGETKYINENTKFSGDYVYVPFSSINDKDISVSDAEIKKYIEANKSEFQVESSRDIKYVRFDIKPSDKDKASVLNEVKSYNEDREEYDKKTNGKVIIKGLKNTTDYISFFAENKSEIPYNDIYQYESEINPLIKEEVIKAENGTVFGPYSDKKFVKLTKLVSTAMLPDSVKARHILIPFIGSRSATADTKQNEAQAKITADSLLTIIKAKPSNFEKYAKDFSKDPNGAKGGDLGWFEYKAMVPVFRDFCFENKKGSLGVVKSMFGYHIVSIDDQKNIQKTYKLVTFSREVVPSEETENQIFEKASLFEQGLTDGKNFEDFAKEQKLEVKPAMGLEALSESVPGLNKQRNIINWAFEKENKVGDFKRFDIENGYVIATLIDKTAKGLSPVRKASAKVRAKIIKEKKAALIKEKMDGATLEVIANTNKTTLKNFSDITLNTPTISGVGREPSVVGAMVYLKENKIANKIVGNKGVFALKITSKTAPTSLENYNTERNRIAKVRKNKTYKIYDALKTSCGVKEHLSLLYGIEE